MRALNRSAHLVFFFDVGGVAPSLLDSFLQELCRLPHQEESALAIVRALRNHMAYVIT